MSARPRNCESPDRRVGFVLTGNLVEPPPNLGDGRSGGPILPPTLHQEVPYNLRHPNLLSVLRFGRTLTHGYGKYDLSFPPRKERQLSRQYLVHHHAQSVDICLFRWKPFQQAKTCRREEFRSHERRCASFFVRYSRWGSCNTGGTEIREHGPWWSGVRNKDV